MNLRKELRADRHQSLCGWMVLEVLAKVADFENIVSDPENVTVTITVNGREFDAKPTIDRWEREVEEMIEERAAARARAMIGNTMSELQAAIVGRLGLKVNAEEE